MYCVNFKLFLWFLLCGKLCYLKYCIVKFVFALNFYLYAGYERKTFKQLKQDALWIMCKFSSKLESYLSWKLDRDISTGMGL